MALCYVNDVLVIAAETIKTMDGIRSLFKLKGDKAEKPDIYQGASFSELETADGRKCWTMLSENMSRWTSRMLRLDWLRVT